MGFDLTFLRLSLYGALIFSSVVLMCLSIVRLNYTNHLARNDPLNGGRPFSDPIIGEILFTTLMSIPWSIYIIYSITKRYENPYFATFLAELIGLGVLWIFWIAGAGSATTPWGGLTGCQQFEQCRILSALVAFSWLAWISVTALFGITLLFTFANKAVGEPLHGRWNPRESQFVDAVVRV